jgi:hypothetical protein
LSTVTADPKLFLAQGLHKLSASNPGVVTSLMGQLQPVVQVSFLRISASAETFPDINSSQ